MMRYRVKAFDIKQGSRSSVLNLLVVSNSVRIHGNGFFNKIRPKRSDEPEESGKIEYLKQEKFQIYKPNPGATFTTG
jgi:hypothetical protein